MFKNSRSVREGRALSHFRRGLQRAPLRMDETGPSVVWHGWSPDAQSMPGTMGSGRTQVEWISINACRSLLAMIC